MLNARSLVKPDAYSALHAELNGNDIDLCFISETWLHSAIPNSLICPPGYSIARKDRKDTRGGGVAILCRNNWRMENILNVENMFECICMKIIRKNLFTRIPWPVQTFLRVYLCLYSGFTVMCMHNILIFHRYNFKKPSRVYVIASRG